MTRATPTCLRFERHEVCWALDLALANAGSNIAARIPMMAMTTSNSIKVKAAGDLRARPVFTFLAIANVFIRWARIVPPNERLYRRTFKYFVVQTMTERRRPSTTSNRITRLMEKRNHGWTRMDADFRHKAIQLRLGARPGRSPPSADELLDVIPRANYVPDRQPY